MRRVIEGGMGGCRGAGGLGDATWAARALGTAMEDMGGDMKAAKRPVEATRADDEGRMRPGGTRRAGGGPGRRPEPEGRKGRRGRQ